MAVARRKHHPTVQDEYHPGDPLDFDPRTVPFDPFEETGEHALAFKVGAADIPELPELADNQELPF